MKEEKVIENEVIEDVEVISEEEPVEEKKPGFFKRGINFVVRHKGTIVKTVALAAVGAICFAAGRKSSSCEDEDEPKQIGCDDNWNEPEPYFSTNENVEENTEEEN